MRAIIKVPGMSPAFFDILPTLEAVKNIVGGPLEGWYRNPDWMVLCNENKGTRDGTSEPQPNCMIEGELFYGTILIVGTDIHGICDLDKQYIDRFMAELAEDEITV